MDFDVFNGDADGICSLLQLRLVEPRDTQLVTGVKRDIALLKQVQAQAGDRVTVLDVSMDKNKADLLRLLEIGAQVHYTDHHFAGDIPDHANLKAFIDEAPEVCTAVLINQQLGGQQVAWAIAGAFGDGLSVTANRLADEAGIEGADRDDLKRLGVCINYNGYGPSLDDLHFRPADLYRQLYAVKDPLAFVRDSEEFRQLECGYQDDIAKAAALKQERATDSTAVFFLPDEAWARRVSGVFGNDLAATNFTRAHAIVTLKADGNYLVSVRAPHSNRQGAAQLCMQFPSGGGRAGAAGINDLPADMLESFIQAFEQTYS